MKYSCNIFLYLYETGGETNFLQSFFYFMGYVVILCSYNILLIFQLKLIRSLIASTICVELGWG